MNLKDWAEEDRPREKLLLKGATALSDAELLAILIGSGSRTQTAVELSRDILHQLANNDLNELGKKNLAQLMDFKGIGEAKAISIVAALELGRRRRAAEINQKPQISCSRDVYELMNHLGDLPHEEFWVLLLNRAAKLTAKELISKGGISEVSADIKLIVRATVHNLASSVILCHNHPSGNLKPSQSDLQLTQRIKQALSHFDTVLSDHLIITDNGYYSFADDGIL